MARLAYAKTIGSGSGEGDGQFRGIRGVDVDEEHIVACDWQANSVSLFSKATGAFVRKFGSEGSGQGQFRGPFGLRLAGGNVYVCDYVNNRVQVLTKEGVFVRFIGDVSGHGEVRSPTSVAVDDEHVVVSSLIIWAIVVFRS